MISNPDRKILVLWVITVALITRRELRTPTGPISLPNPAAYMGSAIVYGIAAVLAEFTGDFAFYLALGWTLAIAFRTLAPNETVPGPTKIGAGTQKVPATKTKVGV